MWQASYTHRLIGAAAATTVFGFKIRRLAARKPLNRPSKMLKRQLFCFFGTFVSLDASVKAGIALYLNDSFVFMKTSAVFFG